MASTTYRVHGMTGDHCVRAVEEEVAAVPGVKDVQVDLAEGRVVVTSEEQVPDEHIRAAVEEAGYSVGESGER